MVFCKTCKNLHKSVIKIEDNIQSGKDTLYKKSAKTTNDESDYYQPPLYDSYGLQNNGPFLIKKPPTRMENPYIRALLRPDFYINYNYWIWNFNDKTKKLSYFFEPPRNIKVHHDESNTVYYKIDENIYNTYPKEIIQTFIDKSFIIYVGQEKNSVNYFSDKKTQAFTEEEKKAVRIGLLKWTKLMGIEIEEITDLSKRNLATFKFYRGIFTEEDLKKNIDFSLGEATLPGSYAS